MGIGKSSMTLVFTLLAALLLASQSFAQQDVIEKRQKLMKANSADAKALKAAVESKDYATIEAKAKEIVGQAGQIVSLFPKGSTQGETRAMASIWEKSDEFAKDAKSLSAAASGLAEAAKSKNDDAIAQNAKALNAACNSCHKTFRAPKK